MRISARAGILCLAVVAGCTLASRHKLDDLYGKTDASRYDQPATSPASIVTPNQ
jgi:hypothetical protein